MTKTEKILLETIAKIQAEITGLRKEIKQNKLFHYHFRIPYSDNDFDLHINYPLTPNVDYIHYDGEYFLIENIGYRVDDDVYMLDLDSSGCESYKYDTDTTNEAIVIYIDDSDDDSDDDDDDEYTLMIPG